MTRRGILGLLAGLVLAMAAGAAEARESLPVAAFVGSFQGSGIAASADSIYGPETARDMDVRIRQAGAGFSIEWTTVIRGDDGSVKRKSEALTFQPQADGVFRTSERADAFSPGGLAWANIAHETLNVYLLTASPEYGYQLQTYARTLTGNGMELLFTRMRGGQQDRTVRGLLVKVAE